MYLTKGLLNLLSSLIQPMQRVNYTQFCTPGYIYPIPERGDGGSEPERANSPTILSATIYEQSPFV